MQKTKKRIEKMTIVQSCSIGVGIGLITMLLLVSIGALSISNEYFTLQNLGFIAAIIQFLTVLIACIITGNITGYKPIVSCVATACINFFAFIGAAILFFDGISESILTGLITVLLGFAVALFVVQKRKNRSVRRTIKKRSR